jgi:hypothetical protein
VVEYYVVRTVLYGNISRIGAGPACARAKKDFRVMSPLSQLAPPPRAAEWHCAGRAKPATDAAAPRARSQPDGDTRPRCRGPGPGVARVRD